MPLRVERVVGGADRRLRCPRGVRHVSTRARVGAIRDVGAISRCALQEEDSHPDGSARHRSSQLVLVGGSGSETPGSPILFAQLNRGSAGERREEGDE